jgi:hypothetical protein
MLTQYHLEITRKALGSQFGPQALETIIRANVHQDDLKYLLGGYPHHHFDDNAFERTYAYLDEQRKLILDTLAQTNTTPAWEAYGRITHAVQDFYAHTNYVQLWLEQNAGETAPDPAGIAPLTAEILASPRLISGRVNIFLELLNLIPIIGMILRPLFPPDIHARMNLDQPSSGPLFHYAFVAAQKRTRAEFETLSAHILDALNPEALVQFTGLEFQPEKAERPPSSAL